MLTTPKQFPSSGRELLDGSPFRTYSYSYPHKTAYRPLIPAVPLREVWKSECRDSLFLYLHVPFCEFRCGFCNLFALSQPDTTLADLYLEAVGRQADVVGDCLGNATFSRLAIGGGTPTFLSLHELRRVFEILRSRFGIRSNSIPASVEASPHTISSEKLCLLREYGVSRLSLGVQSFDDRWIEPGTRSQT